MRTLSLALLAGVLALTGCSRTYDSELLGLKYEPPRGFDFLEEKPGPPRLARFSKGLELLSADTALPAVEEAHLADILQKAWRSSGMPAEPGNVISSRVGTLHSAPVARYALHDGGSRTLLYVVPRGASFLMVRFTSSDAGYAQLESLVERSLGSLRLGK
jgi:hypothetical protein